MIPLKKFLMNKKILSLAFAVMFTTVAVAQDAPEKKKKRAGAARNNPAANVMKQLKDIDLTDEQKTKIEAMAKKSAAAMREARQEAGIDQELMKKRMAAQKELSETIKKPAELMAAVNKKIGLTEAQAAVFKKQATSRTDLLKGVVALLTDEQKAKLPTRLVKMTSKDGDAKGKGKGKGKGKKKKDE